MPRLAVCQAAPWIDAPSVENVEPMAQDGSAAHEVLSKMITAGFDDVGPLRETAQSYGVELEKLDDLCRRGWDRWTQVREYFPDPLTEFQLEPLRVPLTGIEFIIVGRTDVLSLNKVEEAVGVLDWKFGYRDNNPYKQVALCYGLMAAIQFGVEKVYAAGIQARFGSYRTWTELRRDDLLQELHELLESIASWPNEPEYPPGEHCRYCPKIAACPGQKENTRYAIETLNESYVGTGYEQLTPMQKVQVYVACAQLVRMMDAYKTRVKLEILANGPLDDGYGKELAVIQTKQDKIDPVASWPLLVERIPIMAELQECISVRKTAVLNNIKAKVEKGKGKAAEAFMDELREAGAVIEKPMESLKLRKIKEKE